MTNFKHRLAVCRDFFARPLSERAFRRRLLGCFLLALALRIVLALPGLAAPETLLRPDSASYLAPAEALARGEYFGGPDTLLERPAGYPALLALVMKFCGNSLLAMALAGCLLNASAVFPVALAVRRAAGARAGVCGALFWCFSVTALAAAPQILADTMFGVLAAWQCYWAIRVVQERKIKDFICLAVTATAMCLVKPVNLPVVLIGLPVLALAAADSARAFGRFLLIWALNFVIVVLPYWVFMARQTGGFDGNTPNSVFHNGSAVMARVTGESSELWRLRLLAEAEEAFAREPERYRTLKARNQWKIARFRTLIAQHPKAFLITHLPNLANLLPDLPGLLENNRVTLSGGGTMAVLRQKGLFAAADHYLAGHWEWFFASLPLLAVTMLLYAGAAYRLWKYLRHRYWRCLLLFGVLVFYYLWAPGPVISPRYLLPALPFLIVMCFDHTPSNHTEKKGVLS